MNIIILVILFLMQIAIIALILKLLPKKIEFKEMRGFLEQQKNDAIKYREDIVRRFDAADRKNDERINLLETNINNKFNTIEKGIQLIKEEYLFETKENAILIKEILEEQNKEINYIKTVLKEIYNSIYKLNVEAKKDIITSILSSSEKLQENTNNKLKNLNENLIKLISDEATKVNDSNERLEKRMEEYSKIINDFNNNMRDDLEDVIDSMKLNTKKSVDKLDALNTLFNEKVCTMENLVDSRTKILTKTDEVINDLHKRMAGIEEAVTLSLAKDIVSILEKGANNSDGTGKQ